jgi:hypothetical protein
MVETEGNEMCAAENLPRYARLYLDVPAEVLAEEARADDLYYGVEVALYDAYMDLAFAAAGTR